MGKKFGLITGLLGLFLVWFILSIGSVSAQSTVIVDYLGNDGMQGSTTKTGDFLMGDFQWEQIGPPTASYPNLPWAGSVRGSMASRGADANTYGANAYARFRPLEGLLEEGAEYDVYYTNINRTDFALTNDNNNATIRVHHNGTLDTAISNYNQSALNTGFQHIGRFTFSGDGTEYVEIYRNRSGTAFLHTHSVKFEKVAGVSGDPADATLFELDFTAGLLSPEFSPEIESYTISTADVITEIDAVASNTDATVTITAPHNSTAPYALRLGENIFTITVLSANGEVSKTYTVTVSLDEAVISTESAGSYTLDGAGTWQQSAAVKGWDGIIPTYYNGSLGSYAVFNTNIAQEGIYNIKYFRSAYSNSDNNITVEIIHDGVTSTRYIDLENGDREWVDMGTFYFAGDGAETVKLIKTAAGKMLRVGAIKVSKANFDGSEAGLEAVKAHLNGKVLSPVVLQGQNSYTLEAQLMDSAIQFEVYAQNPNASITVNGVLVEYGVPSEPISLSDGANLIEIAVTSTDGNSSQTYEFNINKFDKIIIGYGDEGYSELGEWLESASLAGHDGSPSRYFPRNPEYEGEQPSVTYTPNIAEPQELIVQIYKIVGPNNNDTNVKWEVKHSGVVETFYLDYSQGASEWVTLGVFNFDGNGDEYIKMSRIISMEEMLFTRADAVMLASLPTNQVVFGAPTYQKGDGTEIYKLEEGVVTVKVVATNTAGEDMNLTLIASVFQDVTEGCTVLRKINVSLQDTVAAKDSCVLEATVSIDAADLPDAKLKSFIWSDLNSLVPYRGTYTLN
ncbi:MAG: cadherin-like beta sandwich domain-containing protein [Firmicutes bacterium]|nr:cadherin-like beta sandwich domain-containing protein [Bacillota bacterium]